VHPAAVVHVVHEELKVHPAVAVHEETLRADVEVLASDFAISKLIGKILNIKLNS
jgi:hypothetical protein